MAVLAFFRRRAGAPELAADLTAETFAAALEGARRFRSGGSPDLRLWPGADGLQAARGPRRGPERRVPGRRLTYGLAHETVARVRTGGEEVRPSPRRGLPGRFFSVVTGTRGAVHVVAVDAGGRTVGELGSSGPLSGRPRSQDEARAAGDPAGFGPTARPPSAFVHEGREIPPDEAARRGLACTADGTPVVRCEDP